MAKLLNSQAIVIGLALIALLFVYRNIVSPIFFAGDEFVDVAIIDEDEPDDWLDESPDGGDPANQALQIASVQYDIGHFRSTDLHWNEQPARDPFAPRVTIQATDVSAVLDKVQGAESSVSFSAALPKLSAIVNSARYRYAVINEEIVGAGDLIAGFRVERIGRTTVSLRQLASNRTYNVVVKE